MSASAVSPVIPEVPTPVPQRTQSQAVFDENADRLFASLPGVAQGINQVSQHITERVNAAFAAGLENAASNSISAANSAASAQAQRNLADAARLASQKERAAAQVARNQAEAFAGLAQATNPLQAMQVNSAVIQNDQVLASGFNALSAGPIRIKSGATVKIQNNATWSIL